MSAHVLPFTQPVSPRLGIVAEYEPHILQWRATARRTIKSAAPLRPNPCGPRAFLDVDIGIMRERGFNCERPHAGIVRFSKHPRKHWNSAATIEWVRNVDRRRLQFTYRYEMLSEGRGRLHIIGPLSCGCSEVCRHGIEQALDVSIRLNTKHWRYHFICSRCDGEARHLVADAIAGGEFMCRSCSGDCNDDFDLWVQTAYLTGCFHVRESEVSL